ncbi:response regulator transcription factor [Vallitalea okinawensis]|uniref:response regulator transcription factor n=1 Tax=Vallitalea okinawensis TaxID=2078660 RepID=UPI000CFCA3BB|nr:response regulator transcription factor [Vallitalea okinawensis]
MSFKILVVEDEMRMREFIKEYFEEEEWITLEASNGSEALDLFSRETIDLVILDIMMPGLDGKYVCSKIREESDVGIIMLTALEDETSQLECYNLGADDYITKPFMPKVLVAKVKRFLYRLDGTIAHSTYENDKLKINFDQRVVSIDGTKVDFSPKEFNLLIYLIKANGAVKTRDQILDEIWGYDYYGSTRVVDNHILKIRTKLGCYGSMITTVVGMGYKYEKD